MNYLQLCVSKSSKAKIVIIMFKLCINRSGLKNIFSFIRSCTLLLKGNSIFLENKQNRVMVPVANMILRCWEDKQSRCYMSSPVLFILIQLHSHQLLLCDKCFFSLARIPGNCFVAKVKCFSHAAYAWVIRQMVCSVVIFWDRSVWFKF